MLEQLAPSLARFPRALVVSEVRRAIDAARAEILAGNPGGPAIAARVERALADLERPSLRRVINATGVVLHTNLGRAPLGPLSIVAGYSNLEYDVAAGRRGKRDVHTGSLLERLVGAPGIAVNNNAAAVFLALHELAAGGEAIVSRGELIEIGDGFRIPDIMARSGATLREVGTTNRTRIDDYRAAINRRTRLLMRVHPSNFRISGFTARPELRELAALGRERGIPVYEDLGSGCVVDLRAFGIDEPLVSDSLSAGVDLVSFSGDKLLGGPQAGILAGRQSWSRGCGAIPCFARCASIRSSTRCWRIPCATCCWNAGTTCPRSPCCAKRRTRFASVRWRWWRALPGLRAEVIAGESVIGGGATPEQSIPTWVIAVDCANVVEAERKLRAGDPPVVARIEDGRLIFDLRTVFSAEEETLLRR